MTARPQHFYTMPAEDAAAIEEGRKRKYGESNGVPIREIARRYGKDDRVVRRWVRQGCPTVKSGRAGRGNGASLDPDEVESWLALQGKPRKPLYPEQDGILEKLTLTVESIFKRDAIGHPLLDHMPAHRLLGIPDHAAMAYLLHIFGRIGYGLTGKEPEIPQRLCDWVAILEQNDDRRIAEERINRTKTSNVRS